MNRYMVIVGLALTAYNAYALVSSGGWLVALIAVLYTAGYLFEARRARDSNPQLAEHLVTFAAASQIPFFICALR